MCYVAWGGGEHGKNEYEVLVGSASWVPGSGTSIPPHALPGYLIDPSLKPKFNNFQLQLVNLKKENHSLWEELSMKALKLLEKCSHLMAFAIFPTLVKNLDFLILKFLFLKLH